MEAERSGFTGMYIYMRLDIYFMISEEGMHGMPILRMS